MLCYWDIACLDENVILMLQYINVKRQFVSTRKNLEIKKNYVRYQHVKQVLTPLFI